MERSAKGFAAVAQLLSEPAHDPSRPSPAWCRPPPPVCCSQPPVQRRAAEVVCPQPVRPFRPPASCVVDQGLVYCNRRADGTTFQRQAELELLDFLLGQDGEFDPNGDDGGFFFGTPPARTGNPIINDAEFHKQGFVAVSAASPASCYSPYGAAKPSPRCERASNGSYGSSSASPFTSVPSIRIEGFPSAGSDPHPRRRIVSALA